MRDEVEVIVVDNASPIRVGDLIEERFGKRVKTLRLSRNFFFCGAINRGSKLASGQNIAILNDDCWVEPDWAERATQVLELHKHVAGVASLVISARQPNLIDSAGDHLDVTGRATNLLWMQPVSSLDVQPVEVFSAAGSCAVYRRELFNLAGGLDEDFVAYYEDVDLGFRLRLLGHSILFDPRCRAHHLGGATPKRRARAAFLVERNMSWNLIKNMPSDLMRKYRGEILRIQGRPARFFDGTHRLAWIQGKSASGIRLRKMLAKRERIQATRKVGSSELEQLMLSREVKWCHL